MAGKKPVRGRSGEGCGGGERGQRGKGEEGVGLDMGEVSRVGEGRRGERGGSGEGMG